MARKQVKDNTEFALGNIDTADDYLLDAAKYKPRDNERYQARIQDIRERISALYDDVENGVFESTHRH